MLSVYLCFSQTKKASQQYTVVAPLSLAITHFQFQRQKVNDLEPANAL